MGFSHATAPTEFLETEGESGAGPPWSIPYRPAVQLGGSASPSWMVESPRLDGDRRLPAGLDHQIFSPRTQRRSCTPRTSCLLRPGGGGPDRTAG
jgi:hypothetical protein